MNEGRKFPLRSYYEVQMHVSAMKTVSIMLLTKDHNAKPVYSRECLQCFCSQRNKGLLINIQENNQQRKK